MSLSCLKAFSGPLVPINLPVKDGILQPCTIWSHYESTLSPVMVCSPVTVVTSGQLRFCKHIIQGHISVPYLVHEVLLTQRPFFPYEYICSLVPSLRPQQVRIISSGLLCTQNPFLHWYFSLVLLWLLLDAEFSESNHFLFIIFISQQLSHWLTHSRCTVRCVLKKKCIQFHVIYIIKIHVIYIVLSTEITISILTIQAASFLFVGKILPAVKFKYTTQ